jgi:hypothetical protein
MGGRRNVSKIRLADLLDAAAGLSAWCRICGHHQSLDVGHLVGQLGLACRLGDAARRLRCQACGAREAELRPQYPGLGVVAGHQPVRRRQEDD